MRSQMRDGLEIVNARSAPSAPSPDQPRPGAPLSAISAVLGAAAIMATLIGPCAAQGGPVCSALSRHPCVYHPYHQVCGVFRHRACTYEPSYWFGEELLLTIRSRITSDGQLPSPEGQSAAERSQLRTIADVFGALRSCWEPPGGDAARPGTQLSIRLSFKRDGELLGRPRVTYVSPGTPQQIRQSYVDAVAAMLERCTPLQLSKGLGGALAGRPFAIRFVDDRDRS